MGLLPSILSCRTFSMFDTAIAGRVGSKAACATDYLDKELP